MEKKRDIFELRKELRDTVVWLRAKGRAFEETGNKKMADELFIRAYAVNAIECELGELFGQISKERLDDAQRNTGTMLQAVMVGIDLGKDAK